jgi:hypothetical protein
MQDTEDLIQQAKMVLDFYWTGQYTQARPQVLSTPVVLGLGAHRHRLP